MKEKVFVGLSGGVDSAVAAYLLQKQGYDVTCCFMRNWDSLTNDDILGNPTLNDEICSQEVDYLDAKSVADKLGLPLLRMDFIEEYWKDVFQTFLKEYERGRTPNPDILCNKYIKFDAFFDYAKENGFPYVAMGHYARIIQDDGFFIGKALDSNKDQSYFLAQVKKEVLPSVIFPLGEITKQEVRKIADTLELSVAKKKDSTGICFIGERNFRQFLSNYLPMKPGNILSIANKEIVGQHKGVLYYTVGQRKGLDIGGIGPFYVIGKNVHKNELYVTNESHKEWLVSDSCIVNECNYFLDIQEKIECTAKFRYRQSDQNVCIERLADNSLKVTYPQGIACVTPGQEAVFYLGDKMIAGGVIDSVYREEKDLMETIQKEME